MPKLIRKAALLAKIETTYNTDATPAEATDAVLVENLQVAFANQQMNEQPVVKSTLGAKKHLFGSALKQLTFDVPLKGSGTVDTPPEFGTLLRICGMAETVTATTSVEYAPASDDHESATLYYYEDGALHKLTGCRGTFTFNGPAREPAKLSFTVTGHDGGLTDATLVSPTYDSTVPPVLTAAGFTVDSYAAVISALSFDMGNQVAFPPDINADDGIGEIVITGRDVNGSIDPEAVAVATKDFIDDWKTGSAMALSTGVIGNTAGNQWQIAMPAVSYRDVSFADRDGIRTHELPFGAAEDVGDDELTITFT